jgi:hypothetical protein
LTGLTLSGEPVFLFGEAECCDRLDGEWIKKWVGEEVDDDED